MNVGGRRKVGKVGKKVESQNSGKNFAFWHFKKNTSYNELECNASGYDVSVFTLFNIYITRLIR